MSPFGAFFAELHPRIKRNRARLSAAALYAFVTCALGTSTAIAVAASPVCSQVIHTYVDRLERNRVTAATLKRWHDWGVGHPNWHPSLHARRPKYKKVREDVATNEPISCPVFNPHPTGEIALLSTPLDIYFLPVDSPDVTSVLTPAVFTPAAEGGPLANLGPIPVGIGPIASGTPPVGVPPVTTPPNTPVPPVTPEPVPEPASILLSLTGMSSIAALAFFRRRVF